MTKAEEHELFDQIPSKPKERSEYEIQQDIRKQIGYDITNLFKDEEGDK